ncbi:tyrosine-protein phosphatase [Bdellovibrio sp. 22V]|uniref:tyrosine-protein phosphatase n=1 Tax=Bdellovibrio sp. 22V TaxID=3044166 RepID=UPI0025435D32|nr:tyrosine-protein phosphatase [Bdellovibrio sp. 22V]WII72836.1 tyrosine-protein phosphatase [Bdellovibrio sp. 22V]
MKTLLIPALLILASVTHAAVEGSSISNAYVIYETEEAQIIRGKAPANKIQFQELIDLGVTEFLIFKMDTKGEVEKEKALLQNLGITKSSITHISFPWKDLHDFQSACTMTIQALQTIEEAAQRNRSLYFHCTVGEDRTGYLAGLWGLWAGTYSSVPESVEKELCARGYEAGNPGKPYRDVVLKIRETLTPTYLKMVMVLSEARQRGKGLDESLCDKEPSLKVAVNKYYCKKVSDR